MSSGDSLGVRSPYKLLALSAIRQRQSQVADTVDRDRTRVLHAMVDLVVAVHGEDLRATRRSMKFVERAERTVSNSFARHLVPDEKVDFATA